MGATTSKKVEAATAAADADETKDEDEVFYKCILLGAGSVGKSTVYRRAALQWADGFSSELLSTAKAAIRRGAIAGLQTLLKVTSLQHATTDSEVEAFWGEHIEAVRRVLALDSSKLEFDDALRKDVISLWNQCSQIRDTFVAHRGQCAVPDSTALFLDQFELVSSDDFVPTNELVLHSRIPTVGMHQMDVKIGETNIQLYDVGGQRSERKKWINAFENVACVLFVASLSSFDEVQFAMTRMPTDGVEVDVATDGVMVESMAMLKQFTQERAFRRSEIVVLLSKRDILESKLKTDGKSIKCMFHDYSGADDDVDAAVEFIKAKLLAQNSREDRPLVAHLCNAVQIDDQFTALISNVIKHVNESILSRRALV